MTIACALTIAAVAITPAAAIVGGTADGTPPDTPAHRIDANSVASPWAGVGSLSIGAGTYTATAIDRWFVITAAHVVHKRSPAEITFNLNYGTDLSHRIVAAAVLVHPNYRGLPPKSTSKVAHDDLALVRLAEPLPAGVPTYRLYTQTMQHGQTLTLVGYGASGDGVAGVTIGPSAAVKRSGRNNADAFQPDDQGAGHNEVYAFDFDGPDLSSNRFGGATLGNDIEASLAGGDSGSPAFVQSAAGGAWLLAGVNTFVAGLKLPAEGGPIDVPASRFGSIGGGMLISGYAQWIRSVLDSPPPPDAASPPASKATLWIQLALGGALFGLALKHT